MPSSRSNKENRPEDPSIGEKIGKYVYEATHKSPKADDLVEKDSMGGKIKQAKDARKSAIDKVLSE